MQMLKEFMQNVYHKIKTTIENKSPLSTWLRKNKYNKQNISCFGVNKEGIKCPKASSCVRYMPNPSESRTFIEFHDNYDIKNCEIFVPISQQTQ